MSKANDKNEPVVVFSGNIFEVGFIRSLLENEDIPCFLKDEYMGTIEPWVVSPGGAGSVKLLVPSEHQERALSIIRDQNEIN
ncbi:MAG: DUF2007 domain-containing protein [Chitinophagaceae bacterium]